MSCFLFLNCILTRFVCRTQIIELWRTAARDPPSNASEEASRAEAAASRAACAASLLHQSDRLLRTVVRECVHAARTRDTPSTCSSSAPPASAEAVHALVAASGLGAYTQLLQRAKTRADALLRDALENGHEPRLSGIDPSSDAGLEKLELVVRQFFQQAHDELLKLPLLDSTDLSNSHC